jgi:response regulator NasT
MDKAQITVAMQNEQAAEKIKYALQRNGFSVDICTSGNETIRKVRTGPPDILLVNFEMPDVTGLEVATIIGDENLCSIVLFITNTQRDFCVSIVEDYDITLLLKPINRIALLSTIDTVLQNRRRMGKMEKELNQLKKGLEDRKVIEKAKGILMKHKSISEGEAYRRIQKMSMDSRVAMRDIAIKIVELSQKNT